MQFRREQVGGKNCREEIPATESTWEINGEPLNCMENRGYWMDFSCRRVKAGSTPTCVANQRCLGSYIL